MTIKEHKLLAENIFKIELTGDIVTQIEQPGQFVHIKTGNGADPLLRRPISIANINMKESSITLIYRKEGKGTEMLSLRQKGEKVSVLGPLGNGFPLDKVNKGETALLVGGGIGIPPLYELSKQLVQKGVNVIHVLGFQSKFAAFYAEEFAEQGKTYIATVDGSLGAKGFVTDVLNRTEINFDIIYSCGPTPMLKALQEKYPHQEVFISLEERMGCGIGACLACVCKTTDDKGYKKVCSDGPVFRAGEVLL